VSVETDVLVESHPSMNQNTEKFINFVHAFGAARVLLRKAQKDGALLEGLAIYASLTDAFLRLALVLKKQTNDGVSTIDQSLISQEIDGTYYTERKIQRMALAESVITEGLYEELGRLYDKRNDAIHKFFLTALRYSDLPPVLKRYELVFQTLHKIVYDLEAEQIRRGSGMTHASSESADNGAILLRVMQKISEAD
jgi:hypothetical protein